MNKSVMTMKQEVFKKSLYNNWYAIGCGIAIGIFCAAFV